MKIFLDTADTAEVAKYLNTGMVDGVTTNPTLIRKSNRDPDEVYKELKEIGVKDISMEVMGSTDEMIREGLRLQEKFGEVATIKVPCTREGLEACQFLSMSGRTNVTLVFCAAQAILAAKSGATYVSPFVGRLDDQSIAGLEVVRSIAELYQRQGVQTQVLAASIRNVHRAVRSFYNGASVVTLPPGVFDAMYDHMLTDKGMDIFNLDHAFTQSFSTSISF